MVARYTRADRITAKDTSSGPPLDVAGIQVLKAAARPSADGNQDLEASDKLWRRPKALDVIVSKVGGICDSGGGGKQWQALKVSVIFFEMEGRRAGSRDGGSLCMLW